MGHDAIIWRQDLGRLELPVVKATARPELHSVHIHCDTTLRGGVLRGVCSEFVYELVGGLGDGYQKSRKQPPPHI